MTEQNEKDIADIGQAQFAAYRYEAINELRTNHGLTMCQFGKAIGKSKETVSCWESGERKPHIGTLCEICRVYGVPITYFFEEYYGTQE